MSNLGNLSLKGTSGKEYVFEMFVLNTSFNAVGGLYLFTKPGNQVTIPIYLGHTQDLSTRFTNHHKEKCIDGQGATHISVCRMDDEKSRIAAEKDLLGVYNFHCNEVNN
jgi:hypothetical protein